MTSCQWNEYDGFLVCKYLYNRTEKLENIAGFDLDDTIIKTRSGKKFAEDYDDWEWCNDQVIKKLTDISDTHNVVVFTNQAGISKGKLDVDKFKSKIENILRKLGIPIQVYVSTGDMKYRKPYIGMWEALKETCPIKESKSFYVGDAAGRIATKKKKQDFSACDRLFAQNIGIKFLTPEQFFLEDSQDEPFIVPEFNAAKFLDTLDDDIFDEDLKEPLPSPNQELIILVGYPGSGKSSFIEKYKDEYSIISRDVLKTWQKCVVAATKEIKKCYSVIIDNTSPDKESRARYIELAKDFDIPCRCFVMKCDKKQALHNVKYRDIIGTDETHKKVDVMALNKYHGSYQKPELGEGFTEIVTVNFIPRFKSDKDEQIYRMALIEK